MRISIFFAVLVLLLVSFPANMIARHIGRWAWEQSYNGHHHEGEDTTSAISTDILPPMDSGEGQREVKRGHLLQVEVAGSRLPDCTHACGSCSPCRLVMVSFACVTLTGAETCPISYKCMCNNKSYPVP
ncbi:hypothetical protein I3843_12G120400 [Carya illinoinensis]|uniref:Epidermal patterning factor-like protein n=1 Tax=Carya illinoinensis TaxID=32201 RepID=A0A8T1NYU0_CARIL|nr:hypothetical protein I3760_12G117800 [Carya illinoinensis]KAG6634482.1 hypothetical protein CIPAW_12G121400 [Carya illinoinensis]KAG6685617.1 hypothetical protein I3842_12G120000 [Carya illinoinensis]KAG7953667.1 hypothetical protein I3843_12G120400 [Carya illinoinensis]